MVEKLQTSMQSGQVDLRRLDQRLRPDRHALPLQQDHESDRLHGGKGVHQSRAGPQGLHRHQLHHRARRQAYQLPDQQFANLYWFRADLFARAKDLKDKFKAKYGYDLGVPLNWSAYEDIAEFFTNDVKTIDSQAIYGHMDYGKKDPSLGWRFTDAWLSMAGTADRASRTACRSTNGASAWQRRKVHAGRGRAWRGGGATNSPGSRLCADQVRGLDEEVRAQRKPPA